MCPLRATLNNVILEVRKKERKKGETLLPQSQIQWSSQRPPDRRNEDDFCEIVAVGPYVNAGLPDTAVKLEIGDLVLRPGKIGIEWTDEDNADKVYLICDDEDITAVKLRSA